jgi:site-specific recombinase XerD
MHSTDSTVPAAVHPLSWEALKSLALDGVTSPHTKRAYEAALEEFLIWLGSQPQRCFNKATVQRYRVDLEAKDLAPSSISIRLCAIRKLAIEAADNGLMAPEMATAIARVKGPRRRGARLGNWLTRQQAEQFLSVPDVARLKGLRDRVILAVMLGCGLRRGEVAALNLGHIVQREGRWVIADLIGKHSRIRTVPMPSWAKFFIDRWATAAAITDGPLLRAIDKAGRPSGRRMSEQAIYQAVRAHAARAQLTLAPHDLRRTHAKLAHRGGAPLEQIQLALGHASIATTELYLGVQQDLSDAPCDHLGLKISA